MPDYKVKIEYMTYGGAGRFVDVEVTANDLNGAITAAGESVKNDGRRRCEKLLSATARLHGDFMSQGRSVVYGPNEQQVPKDVRG